MIMKAVLADTIMLEMSLLKCHQCNYLAKYVQIILLAMISTTKILNYSEFHAPIEKLI